MRSKRAALAPVALYREGICEWPAAVDGRTTPRSRDADELGGNYGGSSLP